MKGNLSGVVFRMLLLSSLGYSAQAGIVTGANSSEVQGPDNKGRCWHEAAKGLSDLNYFEKKIYKMACGKDKDTCNDFSLFGTKKEYTACPAPAAAKQVPAVTPTEPKPVVAAPADSKPVLSADGRHLYVCPKGSANAPDGLPVCKTPDGSYVPLQEIPIPAGALPPVANTKEAPGKTK
jgi:hypothetical protein